MFEQNFSLWMNMLQIFHGISIVLWILSKLYWTSCLFHVWEGKHFCCFHCSLLCYVCTCNKPLDFICLLHMLLQHANRNSSAILFSREIISKMGSLDIGNIVRSKTKMNKFPQTKNWRKSLDKFDYNHDFKMGHSLICSVLVLELFFLSLAETIETIKFSGIKCFVQKKLVFISTHCVRQD